MTFVPPSLETPILASSILLHADTVNYMVFEGDHSAVWDLRRKIVDEGEVNSSDILSSTLWTVQVVSQSIHRLWLFYIGSPKSKPLQDHRLVKVLESTIIPQFLYPCSEECSFQDSPCINCHSPNVPSPYTAAKYIPRRPWRRPWNTFLDAIRAALIRGVNRTDSDSALTSKRWTSALKNGFIVADSVQKPNSDEWVTSGWEQNRPLLYVHIQVYLILEPSPRFIVHPTVLRTPYCTLGKTPIAGTALTLLPYGTPAYFMTSYSGPTSALTAQFREALHGLAVDGWEGPHYSKSNGKGSGEAPNAVNFVIVFIPVHISGNADRKGLTVIYPSLLALAIPPSIRAPMDVSLLPALPTSLQPSPMVPAAVVSVTPSVPANGTMNSPLTGPRSAYQFPPPPGPSFPSSTTNAFPTLTSPLVFGPSPNSNQQQQQQHSYQSPLYTQAAGNSGGLGGAGASAPVPGTPFPLSTIVPSTLASSSALGRSEPALTGSHTRNPNFSSDTLLRAHRVVTTASRLSALASPNSPATMPTPGVPTPGTVSATTPGGPSPSPSITPPLIPGSTTSILHQTAAEISAYVEYVAKEREKERERLKEAQVQRGRMISAGSIPNNGALTSEYSSPGTSSRSVPPISIPPSHLPTIGSIMHSVSDAQLFYPSPPTNPPSVSAAGVAMSPAAYQESALLPQIPLGLPSMHDTSAGSNRISPLGSGSKSEVDVIVTGIMGVSTNESSIQASNAETNAPVADTESIASSHLPHVTNESPTIIASETDVIQSLPTKPDAASSWSYFSSDDVDFDSLGTLGTTGGIVSMTGNGMATDDMDMSLFGVGATNAFNFENLNNFGGGIDWNMDPTFGLGSGSTSASGQLMHSDDIGTNLYAAGAQSTNSSFPSFQGANLFSPMARAVTAPAQASASGTQQLSGGGSGSGLAIGMDFEADFTDDDFNFFDNKSSGVAHAVESSSDSLIMPPPPSAPPILRASNAVAPSPDPLSFLNPDESSSFFSSLGLAPLPIGSTPTPGLYGYLSHPSPFSMSQFTPGGPTGFTPLTVDVEVEMSPGLPSPPEEANRSSTNTYEVQLEQGTILSSPIHLSPMRTTLTKFTDASPPAPVSPSKDKKFSPIPFAKSHSQADGKYRVAGGKFALSRKSNGWLQKKYRPAYLGLNVGGIGRSRAASWTSGSTQNSGSGDHEYQKVSEKHSRIIETTQGRSCLPSPPVDSDITDSSTDESDDDDSYSFPEPPPPTSSSDVPPITSSVNIASSSYTNRTSHPGWRPRYDRVTDPRIGVIRRLAGCRQKSRKRMKRDDWSKKHMKPRWLKSWEDDTGRHTDNDTNLPSQDETEDDEDEENDEDGGTADEEEDAAVGAPQELDATIDLGTIRKYGRRERSRPTTPLPAYLPPGPSLISTCFHWVHLASMAGKYDIAQNTTTSEGIFHDSQAPTNLHHNVGITHGVPTPVSPTALIGTSNSASPAFTTASGPNWPPALTPSADIDFIPEGEKTWTLEAAASTIAQECVENPLWSDAWNSVDELMEDLGNLEIGTTNPGSPRSRTDTTKMKTEWSTDKFIEDAWPSDLRVVKQLLAESKALGGHMLLIGDLFEALSPTPTSIHTPKMVSSQPGSSLVSTTSPSSILSPLSPPLLSVAKSEAIIHIMPTALRFWDKLGLGPKGGKKNVDVFVIYEQGYREIGEEQRDGPENANVWRDEQMGFWLNSICELYKEKYLGDMLPGQSSRCQHDGLVSFHFDSSFEKSLATFIASLSPQKDSFVFFILMPLSVMTFASETLCNVASAVDKTLNTYSEIQLLFQFIPEPHILNAAVHPSSPHDFRSECLLRSVYDRISTLSYRAMSRSFFEYGQKKKKYLEVPAFTLARPLSENKVSYSCSNTSALDVLDRHTFLHVGYGISSCGRWILASCIDQRGEAHAMGVWSTQSYIDRDMKDDDVDAAIMSDEMYMVNKVWDFAMQFAEKARVEWRIVFAKSGNMGVVELDAWITHLYSALHSNSQTPLHISLLNVEKSVPWIILPLPTPPQSIGTVAPHTNSKGSSLSRSVSNSMKVSSKSQFFVDTAATTYGIFQKDTSPVSVPPTLDDISLSSDCVADAPLSDANDDYSLADNYPLLPLSSSTLVCVPDSSVLPQMVNIHLIYAAKSKGCAYPTLTSNAADSPQILLRDITNSFYHLSVLSTVRWKMATCSLPFHLGAVETMRKALSTRNGMGSLRQDL
ncbi:mediator complex subunit 13 C-terminal-domain-containing protein [Lentinula aciculospora]|uniref:Mediator of RNA polymerase II transcription subunit 13 n=1 Tax=Lentinula aciculospora TaxID=153920 RepID=A0A9W9A3B7_9AGAR|nr:mediator complex subunit 13 C-terminal-domain-containing protein [Lentinula aciculospora]